MHELHNEAAARWYGHYSNPRPRACRRDAALAGAELALHVEEAVLGTGALDTVGTTGVLELSPNTVNSVPREAHLEIDIRDIDVSHHKMHPPHDSGWHAGLTTLLIPLRCDA